MTRNKDKSLSQIRIGRPSTFQDSSEIGNFWSISFQFMDYGTRFALSAKSDERVKIFDWLYKLNSTFDFNTLMNHTLPHFNGPANHNVSADLFSEIGKFELISKLQAPNFTEYFEDRVLSLRYCFKPNDSQRLICVSMNRVVYPIWWDKEHEIYGKDWDRNVSGLCETHGCLHD